MVGGRQGWRSAAACAFALSAIGAGAGCSGGDDESTARDAQETTRFSEANEPPRVFAERLAKLIATTTAKRDCGQLEPINSRSATRYPCPAPKDVRTSMAGFKVVAAKEYGTGAIVDYESGAAKEGAAIVLFVAPDRNWGVGRFGVITKPSVGTGDRGSRAGYDRAVDAYLLAVRKRDCSAFVRVAFTSGAKEKSVCATLFPMTRDLAKRLKANPTARPEYEGGNRTYGFYTLETPKPKPQNVTISVVKSGDGKQAPFVVLDATPSPTAATQRRVRREHQKQQKMGNPNDMEPSSKPSDPAVTTP